MTPRQFRGPLVLLGARDASKLVETLACEDVIASSRGSRLRISFHYYNVPEDVQAGASEASPEARSAGGGAPAPQLKSEASMRKGRR